MRKQGVVTDDEFERGETALLGSAPDKAASAVELLQKLNALKKEGVLSESEFNKKNGRFFQSDSFESMLGIGFRL
jgi:hypothetical protein